MRSSFRWVMFVRHPARDGGLEAWERRENSVIEALPAVMLAFTTIMTIGARVGEGRPWILDLALCVIVGAWLAVRYLRPSAWCGRGWTEVVFFTVLVVLMGILVYRDPWFGFFTFTAYFYAMRLPATWGRVSGVVVTAILTGTSQSGGVPVHGGPSAYLWFPVVAVNLLVAGGFTWFGWVSRTQNEKRKVLVDELRSANERLEATLTENAGLHQQLLVQAREAGVLDERQRMAREIHDTLAQGLTGIITQLQAAEQASGDPVARRRHFDTATQLARDSLAEARRSVDELRPQVLEQARLSDALASVAERWSALHGVAVQVTVTGPARPMAPDTEFALLRTAQETLANVAKHASASRVGLTLSYMDSEAALDVRDDGRGFDPSASARVSGGYGLIAMRERIEALSGTLEIESEPGAGTAVSARVPFQPTKTPAVSAPLAGAVQ